MTQMTHRCVVCWEFFGAHDTWFKHAERKHGAVLAEFGYDICQSVCPGEEHMRLRQEGHPPRRIVMRPALDYVARDGTRYVQQHLDMV